jgi:biotin transport system ATP-binding protein
MRPVVTIRNLSLVFDGVSVLSGVSFDLIEGECLMICGANGSGKTVLMKILAGFIPPSSGDVVFTPPYSRKSVGLVFQDADSQIIGETVAEDTALGPRNLKLPAAEVERRVTEALMRFGLDKKAHQHPRALSGGEKRRLAIAGIAVMRKTIIIFDEPVANLDYPGVLETIALLEQLKAEGKTVILLTHELEKSLALAGRLAVLSGGGLTAIGTPAEVLNRLDASWGVRDPRVRYDSITDCVWR